MPQYVPVRSPAWTTGSHALPLRLGKDSISPLVKRLWKLWRTHKLQSLHRHVRVPDIKLQQDASFHPSETQVGWHRNEQKWPNLDLLWNNRASGNKSRKNYKEETLLAHSQRIPPKSQCRLDETAETFQRKRSKWHICIVVRTDTVWFFSTLLGGVYLWHYRNFYLIILNLFLHDA